MEYVVKAQLRDGGQQEKKFASYREALCYATNYSRVRVSQVIRQGVQLHDIKF